MDMKLFINLIDKLASKTPRPYLYCHYDGAHHEGFLEGASQASNFSVAVDYKMWSTDENTYIPATMYVYEEDLGRFYIGEYDRRKTLMCKYKVDEDQKIYAKQISDAPEWSPSLAESTYKIGKITFSARDGLGSVPSNANVWYEGFVATMRPSTFLLLALDDEGHQEPTSKDIEALVEKGYAIGIPFLEIEFDEDGNELPRIRGHEGRGRMRMIKRVLGDHPIPVHFFLRGGLRSRHLTPEMTDEVKMGIFAERSDSIVRRPVADIWVNGKKV